MYISQPGRATPPPAPIPSCSTPALEKPNGVRVEVLNPIEKCYFNADARLLGREEQGMATGKQPQNWIKVCYTPHGAGNVPDGRADGRTRRQLPATPVLQVASFCMQLNTRQGG